MEPLEGKRVTVMGLGLHGGALGTIQWLQQQKAIITVTDMKSESELQSTLAQLKGGNMELALGGHRESDFTNADLIIRNPAVRRDSKHLRLAQRAGVPIEMDSSLFFKLSPTRNIIGITGSKGKSTTTHALQHLLQLKYPKVITVGFDQASPLGKLPQVTPDSLVIFELSSWRLEALDANTISPQTAVVTSIYRDHLNTYDSFEHYIDTKKAIIRHQTMHDRALLNADDKILRSWSNEVPGKLYWFSTGGDIIGEGVYIRKKMVTVVSNRVEMELFPVDTLRLPSEHERRNLLPAILLGFLGNIPAASIKLNLSHLKGLAHRLEVVRTAAGVTYINDSAATMPDATIAAMRALKGRSIVHILGGSDKKLKFEELARLECRSKILALVFLPGDATLRLQLALEGEFGTTPPIIHAANMVEAVQQAARFAQAGDVVLLSPAATSFGLFQHEFERGDQFRRAVAALPNGAPAAAEKGT